MKKSRIQETPTLSACADSSTDTMKSRLFDTFWHFSALFSHVFAFFCTFCDFSGTFCKTKNYVSHVISHMSHVTFHLSLTPTATDLPLLTPPLCKFDVLLDLESLEPYLHTLFYEDRRKNMILWLLWTITTFSTIIIIRFKTILLINRLYESNNHFKRVCLENASRKSQSKTNTFVTLKN